MFWRAPDRPPLFASNDVLVSYFQSRAELTATNVGFAVPLVLSLHGSSTQTHREMSRTSSLFAGTWLLLLPLLLQSVSGIEQNNSLSRPNEVGIYLQYIKGAFVAVELLVFRRTNSND